MHMTPTEWFAVAVIIVLLIFEFCGSIRSEPSTEAEDKPADFDPLPTKPERSKQKSYELDKIAA